MQNSVLRKTVIAAILLAVPLVLLCFAFLLPPQYDETYLAGLQDKTFYLKSAKGKKIVLVGGSGAAFDVRSDLLEEQFPGYSVVNYGLYAGLGTTVMLELSKPYIGKGDLARVGRLHLDLAVGRLLYLLEQVGYVQHRLSTFGRVM